jgi:hypothetical protein
MLLVNVCRGTHASPDRHADIQTLLGMTLLLAPTHPTGYYFESGHEERKVLQLMNFDLVPHQLENLKLKGNKRRTLCSKFQHRHARETN